LNGLTAARLCVLPNRIENDVYDGAWRRNDRCMIGGNRVYMRIHALGHNYAQPVIMRSSRVQALHAPRRISGIMLSLKAPLYA
jgi:hypothetical protein